MEFKLSNLAMQSSFDNVTKIYKKSDIIELVKYAADKGMHAYIHMYIHMHMIVCIDTFIHIYVYILKYYICI